MLTRGQRWRKLIAMRTDPQLSALLGLTAPARLSQRVPRDPDEGPGVGIEGQTIQFDGMRIGTAWLRRRRRRSRLATPYSSAATSTSNPAVTLRRVGSAGRGRRLHLRSRPGRSSRPVRVTRLGRDERDGIAPMRSDDLFYGAMRRSATRLGQSEQGGDPAGRRAAAAAGEHDHYHERGPKPLPRFWYFPRGYKAVVVMTGDDHAANRRSTRLMQDRGKSPRGLGGPLGVPRCTAYIFDSPNPSLTNDTQAAAYDAQGFEIGVHLNTGCSNWTRSSLT